MEKSFQIFVETCQELGETQEQISQRLQEKYGMSEAEARKKVKLYWCQ